LNPDVIDRINHNIGQAETETRHKENKTTGKNEPNPTRLRSEVGAIQEILPYTASDKRNFSTKDAVKWLSDPQTGGSYIIELFETIPLRKTWDLLQSYKFDHIQSFIFGRRDVLKVLVVSINATGNNSSVYSVKLEKTDLPTVIQLISPYPS